MRGVIQFANSLSKDKLRIGVSDSITNINLTSLDGDSNLIAGGVLDFRFDILVGDTYHDGSFNGGDLPFFASSFDRSTSDPSFNPRANWNSDDSVNGGDLPHFAANFDQSLPGAEPGSLNFPPPILPAPNVDEKHAPFYDVIYSQFDDEDGWGSESKRVGDTHQIGYGNVVAPTNPESEWNSKRNFESAIAKDLDRR